MDRLKCPYCKHTFKDEAPIIYSKHEIYTFECAKCERTFVAKIECKVAYTTYPAECKTGNKCKGLYKKTSITDETKLTKCQNCKLVKS